jgi:hypothetical protein
LGPEQFVSNFEEAEFATDLMAKLSLLVPEA